MNIEISLNGETKTLADNILLIDAISLWNLSDKKIAVAINGEFVSRSTYAERKILSGDQIDIVKPIGGG